MDLAQLLRNNKALAMTHNNMACHFRKKNQLRAALIHLEKALELEASLDVYKPEACDIWLAHKNKLYDKEQRFRDIARKSITSSAKAETHLNTCAVLSQLDRHDLALQHAHQAIMIIQTKLLFDYLPS
jgi:tetratricopeptide (TPR) repeat protein